MRNRSFFIKNPDKLYECLTLRQQGWSFDALAVFYHVDRTSIRDHARKYVIIPIPQIRFNPINIARNVIIQIVPRETSNWIVIDGERINTGKSYKDYLSPSKVKEV